MDDLYSAGLRVHSYLALTGSDQAFSFYDDQGAAYTLAKGDRIVVDELVVTQGSGVVSVTIYFDYTAAGSYTASSGEEVYVGTLPANFTAVFPNCASRASNRIATQAPALRAILGSTSTGATATVNARILRS